MWRVAFVGLLAVLANPGATIALAQQQSVDTEYDTNVAAPAYTARHPSVLFDEAHHNFHTTGGLYRPFAELIRHDGYRVGPNKKPFSRGVLERHQVLIIANATGAEDGEGPQAANPAFTETECQVVDAWVKAGGALLLITDHHEFGAAAQRLAGRLGVEMSHGGTVDPRNSVPGRPGRLVFSSENHLLGDHPIVQGRNSSERINRVVTYWGQSLVGPRGSAPLLRLGETAVDQYPADDVRVRAAGRCQGVAFLHGKGRVVVLGEAGALSAQFGPGGQPFGMNDPGNDNRQLALNTMHWLSGLISTGPRTAAGKPGSPRRSSGPSRRQGP